MRILGIDLGDRHIGIAVWDDPDVPAQPLTTLNVAPNAAVAALVDLARREAATELVVGLPLRLDGREGLAARQARALAKSLAAKTGLPVALEDERLTTTQAHTHRKLAGAWGRAGIDARAATIILQTFIDRRAHACRDPEADE